MIKDRNKARFIIGVNDDGFFASKQTPVFHSTNSNTPWKVSSYPVHCVPAEAARLLFSTPKTIHLYYCDANPKGMGVIR